jgi:multiple sugar transport system substrate-binding protein
VEAGLVRDLAPFLQVDPDFLADKFYANALASTQWNGGTWALPITVNTRLVFYDKDAFDKARLPYPAAGWSWDDLLADAKALTVRAGDVVTRWGFVPNWDVYRLIESRAGALADYGADPPLPRFDDDDVIQAVRWYTDLYLKDQVMPYFEPAEEEESLAVPPEQALIDNGQAAIWTDTDLMWWLRRDQGNIGVVPFPVDAPDALTTPVSVDELAMSAGTAQPNAAWRWMEFLSRQPLGGLALGMKFLPARHSAAETGGFWNDLDEEFATAQRYAADHGHVLQEAVGYEAFTGAVHAIFQEEKAVEDAVVDAQAQVEAEIQEAIAGQAGATPLPTFVVAPPEEETPVSGEAARITFIPGLGSLNLEPYRDLARQFNETNPDVAVEVQALDLMSGATPDLPSLAGAADCFQWYPSFQEARNREAILSLTPLLEADPSFTTDDFLPQVLEQFTWQGQLLGLPADLTPYVIEYNKDLFDAARLDYPALDWTPEDFLGLAVTLTQGEDEEKQYGFVGEYYSLNDLLFMTERLGAKFVNLDADPPALSFNDPDTVAAVRWYAGLTTEHGVKPVFLTDITKLASAGTAVMEREALINNGRAAMWTASGTMSALLGRREGINIGVAPLPAKPGLSGGGYAQASGYFVSAATESPQACWQWITFLTGQPAAMQGLPARRSVAESDVYRQQVGAERADAYLASVKEGEESSAVQIFAEEEWLGGALFWLGQAYGDVIDGEASVEEALDTAQRMADDYRACVVGAGDFGQQTWQACVKQIDPTLPDYLFGTGQ